jgi:hypothetical protein
LVEPLFCPYMANKKLQDLKNLQFPNVNIFVHILHIRFSWCII